VASRYAHAITQIHSDLTAALDGLLGPAETQSIEPLETTFETKSQ